MVLIKRLPCLQECPRKYTKLCYSLPIDLDYIFPTISLGAINIGYPITFPTYVETPEATKLNETLPARHPDLKSCSKGALFMPALFVGRNYEVIRGELWLLMTIMIHTFSVFTLQLKKPR